MGPFALKGFFLFLPTLQKYLGGRDCIILVPLLLLRYTAIYNI
jgi:hypothetical protein